MSEAQDQILKMVEEGAITAEEADRLLAALGPEQSVETVAGDLVVADLPQPETVESSGPPPDFNRFRRFWRIPFIIAAGSLLLSGLGLAFMYQADEGVATLGFLCIWSIFLLAFLATILILLARRAPWLHVRIQEKDGRRFAISMPLPMRLATWALAFARYFVPKEQAMHVDTAAAFVTAMQENPEQEPIIIDVDDDGDKVEVYIG
ncbi:MAG: hypothetical protein JSW55_03010 [Chloroflexota bacterium]|nr:MAG: hypothetical protein JSW55_03010 [Chloroflexota bacterium]